VQPACAIHQGRARLVLRQAIGLNADLLAKIGPAASAMPRVGLPMPLNRD
jgi:hypothetical protein